VLDLDPLPSLRVRRVELVRVPLALALPLRTARAVRSRREVLLVHVVAEDVEGWAECVAEPEPTYGPETVATASIVLREHLVPLLNLTAADAADSAADMARVRGNQAARAALELAVLDAQLRLAGRSFASWLGATAGSVAAGATLGVHDRDDELVAEARDALGAGAARLRVKVAPGRAAAPLRALRAELGTDVVLQADANGSFRLDEPAHVAELDQLDESGLACLEQPLDVDDLVGHAALAERLSTPICLDESVASPGALEAAVALGACEVLCLKAGRIGGWHAALRVQRRCVELGLGVWVGGMLETAVGRAANLALAALPGMTLPPDVDPRGRYAADLADPQLPVQGAVAVPESPGACPPPTAGLLLGAEIEVVARA
jgi:O-succinylbenzoate synthase